MTLTTVAVKDLRVGQVLNDRDGLLRVVSTRETKEDGLDWILVEYAYAGRPTSSGEIYLSPADSIEVVA